MKDIKDYQWPQAFLKSVKFKKKLSNLNDKNLIKKIESFFERKLRKPVKLFPSARSCIGSILEFEKISRGDEVFVNKWLSSCIFNAVGYFSNPTVNFGDQKIYIANNNWGIIQNLNILDTKKIIIDDSSDSIILDNKFLFPNKSKYEIFSLPKIIGSVAGGIVISKDKKYLNYCKLRQKKIKNLVLHNQN
jgi:putative PLP-dependent aminotransferase (TIGR04422 family)